MQPVEEKVINLVLGSVQNELQCKEWQMTQELGFINLCFCIQLLESPIPTAPAAAVSQKASSDDILGTKRGTIDPLVSKRPEKILNKKKMVKNGQKWSKTVKMVKMV